MTLSPEQQTTAPISDFRRTLASEAIFVVAVTAATYITVYSYEAGFCGVFGVPLSFIRPEISTVLFFTATLSTLFFALLNVIYLYAGFREFISRRKNPILRRAILTNGPMLVAALMLGLFADRWAFLIGVSGMIALEVVLQLTNKGSAEEKLQEWDREVERTDAFPYSLLRRLRDAGTLWLIRLVIWALIIEFGLYFVGQAAAKRTTEFLVTDLGGPAVVLRVYGDDIICAQFEPTTKMCSRKFTILKRGDAGRIFEMAKVGPLVPTKL